MPLTWTFTPQIKISLILLFVKSLNEIYFGFCAAHEFKFLQFDRKFHNDHDAKHQSADKKVVQQFGWKDTPNE